jgi:Predicted ATPase (AAA+ superfamily)
MPITTEILRRLILEQREDTLLPQKYIQRDAETALTRLKHNAEIIVVTGVRRCGKSVLMQHQMLLEQQSDYYMNFEDERLANFTVEDFQTLQETFIELYGVQKVYYFDEIQNIDGWEMFARRLYNGNNKIYITGSNANLFSEELGTRLTGRYIALTMYPVSFAEYTAFKHNDNINLRNLTTKQIGLLKGLFKDYMSNGGIPAYIKDNDKEYLHSLYESILYRDIISRYKITDPTAIKKLLFYLASNCGKETSYSALSRFVQVASSTTIAHYCGYIENSYLCFFVNRYNDSIKAQQQAPKKVYFIDHVLAKVVGFRNSEDYGRTLENIVYLELRRRGYEIYYYSGKKECDFVVRSEHYTSQVIQVCPNLADPDTKQREYSGLLEAMQRFSLDTGLILTEDENFVETVVLNEQNFKIQVTPIWKWLLA